MINHAISVVIWPLMPWCRLNKNQICLHRTLKRLKSNPPGDPVPQPLNRQVTALKRTRTERRSEQRKNSKRKRSEVGRKNDRRSWKKKRYAYSVSHQFLLITCHWQWMTNTVNDQARAPVGVRASVKIKRLLVKSQLRAPGLLPGRLL